MVIRKINILNLYKRCLKCAQKIPDPSQRATYLIYVSDGFRRKAQLPSNSREAVAAYRDGFDQVEQMEYYQKMAAFKQSGAYPNETHIKSPLSLTMSESLTTGNTAQWPTETVSASYQEVGNWLKFHLPLLKEEDVTKYCTSLVDAGFDSQIFIEDELIEDDIDFMKKAHKRVILRHLKNIRKERT